MSNPEIREAELGDAMEIGALIRSLAEKFIIHESDPAAREHFLAANNDHSIRTNMRAGFAYFVASLRGEIVGVVGVKDRSHLFHLFVAEQHQGAGLARKLWERALSDTISDGGAGIITVNSSNHAVGFYRKLGFTETGPRVERDGIQYNPMAFRKTG